MENIYQEVGNKIRIFRKAKNMTLNELSNKIYKSKATISKYEKGEIAIDLATLYDIATALQVNIDQLLIHHQNQINNNNIKQVPTFFNHINQFYGYIYDGRNGKLIRCLFDILYQTDNQYKVVMYMNFKDKQFYQKCENTYWGYIEHYDAITNIILTNQDSPMERASLQILATYLDSETKWGLFNGFSSRPMMPIATKMLICKKEQVEDEILLARLKISKEDIKNLRHYNMLSII